ncbi:efflux RND transporter permease subunit [Dasania sp. GY-MA-18]|uniref:Efflux RND transporter permease subunit n=1 Tax=Dasania phycosphaerae TaxID=2950436 RepID=A0A9J6RS45_9GAMM|nr:MULTISPECIES: efflux RND transporter permease subunit [Dasania]MCR8924422.1 efflux RND transporter permease subunit [Dasania sp. GY-MA-18]MCZ0867097.1 efflux RND transporter permease subunit [Dasania phycosphaerae]MCZ0870549.1 efflux RND transporter permease subunit [Dasania phycosphaerae]
MKFTDLFITRPVLACVVSFFILLVGFNAYEQLGIRKYPKIEDAAITVSTSYVGASADLVQGFITTPTQQAIASAEGIAYITSTSSSGLSTVVAHIRPDYSADKALTEIVAKAAEIRGELPDGAKDPVITKGNQEGTALMYLSFSHPSMAPEEITDYLKRVVQPQLATIEGMGEVQFFGARNFAMRIWLDPTRMAAYNITAAEVNSALLRNNFLSTAGETRDQLSVTQVKADTNLTSISEFENIVLRNEGDRLVRIKDIAQVSLSADSFDMSAFTAGEPAVMLGISPTPGANPLDVAKLVRKEMSKIQQQVPDGMIAGISYDVSLFIESSIKEVLSTLLEASLIVVVVVFLFLGQLRSVIIPVVAIPLSLVGTLFLIWMLGYSINLLTLLALVLCIGLVVDDAIVVVENIHRHIEEGHSPKQAALMGAREIAMPVISMTLTLAAVYAPLGFLAGLTGTLFKEFAFTLAGSVIISGIIALTLSPMMCSKLLTQTGHQGFAGRIDDAFERLMAKYKKLLRGNLQYRLVTLVFAILILLTIPPLMMVSQSELAPNEDEGFMLIISSAPQYSNLAYMEQNTRQFEPIYQQFPEYQSSFLLNSGANVGDTFGGMLLKDWSERERSIFDMQQELQDKINTIPGINAFVILLPPLPGSGGGAAVQLVIKSVADHKQLAQVSEQLLEAARNSGLFMFIDSDLKFSKPELQVSIDRDKAAQLGISMEAIGTTLSTLLGEGEINRFALSGRSYKVIAQSVAESRNDKDWLGRYYLRTASGGQVPLSAVITIDTIVQPKSLNQFQQLNAVKLEGAPAQGVSLGDALDFLNQQAESLLPAGFQLDYDGQSRQYYQEGGQLYGIFFISLIAIYLVLAAQFESFRDPFVILVSVPLSICGALIPIALGFASLNIYSQIGLITLIGLISKHGILIVEFANRLTQQGYKVQEAVIEAATVRLRPVLMTTAAMVLGVMPLIFASGAGAVSRYNIGLVIATGMTIGTLFTLFVVPVMYSYLAREHKPVEEVSQVPLTAG